MIKPIRILRIIARLNIGGPAIQAISLTRELSNDLHKTLLVCGNVGPDEGDMIYLAQEQGVKPLLIPELGREISFTEDIRCFFRIREIIKHFRPDIIHTHTAKAGSLGRLAALSLIFINRGRFKDIRLVHTFHGHIFHDYFSKAKTTVFILIEKFLSRFTDRIIVISPLQKQDICNKYGIADPRKVSVIPLGFDLNRFIIDNPGKNIREKYLPHQSKNVLLVGIIGRLTRIKNHHMFLDAVKILKDNGRINHFKFLIIGDGELKQELMRYAVESGIQDVVSFPGWQKDMPDLYGALDVVVITSLNEGTPVTLIESMASGKPVIATDVGGVPDLLGFEGDRISDHFVLAPYGILVPSGNAGMLAKALIFVLEHQDLIQRKSKQAKDFVFKRFTIKRLVSDMKSSYSELMNCS
ncbi:MAG: glycosyltransferase [Deltaproteobacteria bacterium]|nr:glycosyltransferase [Deltaproteobacteria bacterium]